MPKPRQSIIQVPFPAGGEKRRRNYRDPENLSTTSRAINVRSNGSLENRSRGGSRPGLKKFIDNDFGTNITGMSSVTYLDGDGNRQQDLAIIADGTLSIVQSGVVTEAKAYLSINGNKLTINGDYLVFNSSVSAANPLGDSDAFQMAEWNGKLYIADSTLRRYSPSTGQVNTVDNAPTGQPLVCIYQERIVLSGSDHMFYISAQADGTNWTADGDMNNMGRPTMGRVGEAGVIGEKILALHNYKDEALIFGCLDSVWVLYGNPVDNGSKKQCVSPFSGIISHQAMAVTPNGLVFFLTRAGLYSWQVGSQAEPAPFSPFAIPEELLDVDTSTTDVLMEYDHRSRGVHLFLTPHTGVGSHWWISLDNKAFWAVKLNAVHQPLSTAVISRGDFSNVLLGCSDGYIRVFDDDETTDDSEDLNSHLILGPFQVSGDGYDGLLNEIVSAVADDSGTLKFSIYTGETAEEAVDDAYAAITTALAGTPPSREETLRGRAYPRVRGPWATIYISSDDAWAFESMHLFVKRTGRHRDG